MLALLAAAPSSNGSSLALLAGVVAIFRRKHAIGGWLFYFFCQVLLGLLLIAATTRWKTYLPRAWSDGVHYFLYILSNLPRVVLLAMIAVVCVQLVRTREWRWVGGLRYALITYAFLTAVKVQIDIFWFPNAVSIDVLSLTFPCVWIAYFGVSRRVHRVFHEKTWGML